MISEEIMEVARREARKSTISVRMGAVLFDNKGKIIAAGHNKHTNGRKCLGRPTIHAEVDVLNKVHKPSPNLTMLVYRDGYEIKRPCVSCWKLIKTFGIKKVMVACK